MPGSFKARASSRLGSAELVEREIEVVDTIGLRIVLAEEEVSFVGPKVDPKL